MIHQKYIIKNLAPWMMDELLAFSMNSEFDLILLRKQKPFYEKHYDELRGNGVDIFVEPRSNKGFARKLLISLIFFFSNLFKFRPGYNMIIGIKGIRWFLLTDLSLFSEKSNIHCQFATQAPVVAILIKRYFNNEPLVSFTFHAYDIYFKNRWFGFLVKNCIKAFSISEFNIDYVKREFGTERNVELSRLGVFRRENSKPMRERNSPNELFTIGLLSWFIEKKGIIYLLQALKKLADHPNLKLKLILAGDGPLREEFLTFVKENQLSEMVDFIGKISKEEKPEFFENLDAFVLPSVKLKNDQDGIPVVIMEALDYHLPIISTKVSGIPEICKNDFNGKLIPERDSMALANAIKDLALNPERCKAFGRNSYSLGQEYDIELNSQKKLEAIQWL